MTRDEAMEQFGRLLANCVAPADPDAVFGEWFGAFDRATVEDVAEGITRLLRGKADRFWPSIGELRGAMASVQAGREPVTRCRRCGGSSWVEARPYRANGEHIYEGVIRCPDCGVPSSARPGASQQTPLSETEYRAWLAARPVVDAIPTWGALLAVVRARHGSKVAALLRRDPGMEG